VRVAAQAKADAAAYVAQLLAPVALDGENIYFRLELNRRMAEESDSSWAMLTRGLINESLETPKLGAAIQS
jgi:hypothetical protein